ncbi:MAG: DUF1294 domain-containing protein [Candidatus Scalindua sp.]|nr:DUF1294 domain-containing protein [Candidatus Scalindua sp.]
MRTKGKITSWNDGKAYGFISPMSGGRQVFLHINSFSNRSRQPKVGQIVTYNISTDKQGRPCAAKATLAGDLLQQNKKESKGFLSISIAVIFLIIVALSVLGDKLPPIILEVYVGLSVMTYFVYAVDKSAAKKGAWRTQESTLHLFAFAGGWPGALIAQQKLRHKSKKEGFRIMFWITVFLNCGIFIWLFSETGSSLLNRLLQTVA